MAGASEVGTPVLRVRELGGHATVAVDGEVVGSFGGPLHWRRVETAPVPVGAFDDGRIEVVITLDAAPQTWPAGAWLDGLWVVDSRDADLIGLPLQAHLAATGTAFLVMTLVGVVHLWLARRLLDPLVAWFGAALVTFGAVRTAHAGWALGVLPLLPLELSALYVASAVGLGLLQASALALLAPEWVVLRRWGSPATAALMVLGDVGGFGGPAGTMLAGATLLAALVQAAIHRRPAAVPVALGLLPGGVSLLVHAAVSMGAGGALAAAELPSYVLAVIALPLGLVGGLATRLVRAADAADRFVPREYLAAIGAGELADAVPGTRVDRELTVLFTDVRGFTALSERLGPEALARVVDQVLAAQAEAVVAHGGFVDKYVGDALMALFPAGSRPAEAALACVAAVNALGLGVSVGAGLHHGRVQVGVVGSRRRLACTALGDTVNLASRVEGHTRDLGVAALATHDTPTDGTPRRDVGRVVVKGRAAPVALVELGRAAAEGWDAAFALVDGGRFADAAAAFAAWPDDPVARVWVERCRDAPAGWDGVVKLTHK